MTRRRLDAEMMRRGLVGSRTEAHDAIRGGRVTVAGRPALKPGSLVAPGEPVSLTGPARPWVSRGGEKLVAAIERFRIRASGRRCLDAGSGTGGFTDVLLARGAEHVVSVDVGYGQLAWRLRVDPRVTVMERFNVRDLRPEHMPYAADIVVADLSFISLTKVVPALAGVADGGAEFVLLVKPQFEAGRLEVGRGVVSDPTVWSRAVSSVAESCRAAGLGPAGVMASPVLGPAGNVEFFLLARAGEQDAPLDVDAALAEAPSPRRGVR